MGAIQVILADDHPIVREGLRNLLERNPDIKVCGEASTGEEVLRLLDEVKADVLILDMELPDINGREIVRQLKESQSPTKTLVLSAHGDPVYVRDLLSSGISGYLVKEEASSIIVDAVRGVARGEQGWVSRGIAAQLVSWMRGEAAEETKFTPRETDILRLVAEGKTNQGIATNLGISEKTVEKYLNEIFKKMDVGSRTEVAVYAVRAGLV